MKEYRNIIEIDRGTLQRLRPVRAGLCGRRHCDHRSIRRLWFRTVTAMGSARAFPDARRTRFAIVRREAVPFDEEAAMRHVARQKGRAQATAFQPLGKHEPHGTLGCGCSGTTVREFAPRKRQESKAAGPVGERRQTWPVKLRLVPPSAPFLKGADILLAADCSAPASARFCEIASGKGRVDRLPEV